MRTTLDIDDDVLQAARQRAKAESKTAGQIISDLARQALEQDKPASGEPTPLTKNGFTLLPTFPSRGGIVTPELVEDLLAEEDLEIARASRR